MDTVIASSAGYVADSLRIVVTHGRAQLNGVGVAPKVGTAYNVTLAATDSAGTPRPVADATTFSIAVSEGMTVTDADGASITTVTIPAGQTTSAPFVLKATAAGAQQLLVSRLDYVPLALNMTAAP